MESHDKSNECEICLVVLINESASQMGGAQMSFYSPMRQLILKIELFQKNGFQNQINYILIYVTEAG